MSAPAGSVLIRNIGSLLSGDISHPLLSGSSVYVEGGVIAEIGIEKEAELVIDARGKLLSPGLWDGHHYPYFGDHTPQFEARGYLERTIRGGTTSLVSAGTRDIPGRPHDAYGSKYLAILSAKSWKHDRPHEIKIHAGTVIAEPGLSEADFKQLAGAEVRRISFLEPLDADEARQCAGLARAAGLTVMARGDGEPLVRGAGTAAEALDVIQPDVVYGLNDATAPLPMDSVQKLLEHGSAALGVSAVGNLNVASRLVHMARERGALQRIVLGTGTPSPAGVLPGGVQSLVGALAVGGGLKPEEAMALASGNVARAYGLPGGLVSAGQPADLVLFGLADHTSYKGELAAIADGGSLRAEAVLMDGRVEVLLDDSMVSINR